MKHPAVVHYKKVDSPHSTLLFWTAKCQKRNNKIFKSLSSCQKISAEILIHCGFFWKSIKKKNAGNFETANNRKSFLCKEMCQMSHFNLMEICQQKQIWLWGMEIRQIFPSNQNGLKYWQKGQVHPLSYCGKIFFWFGYLESRFSREVAAFLVICTLITAFLDKGQAL